MKPPEKKEYPFDFSQWCEHNHIAIPEGTTNHFDWCLEAYNNICEIFHQQQNTEYLDWMENQIFEERL